MPTTRVRLFTAALLGTASLFATLPAFAAEDAGDVAALKAQIEALSKRINELETKQKAAAAKPAEAPVKTAAAAATPTNPANPGEGKPVVGGSMPGSFKLPGTETSVKFGGYAKLDAIEDVGGAFGVRGNRCLGMFGLELQKLGLAECLMDDAHARPQEHVAPGLAREIAAEMLIGAEDDLLIGGQLAEDPLGR